jgi:hypothetical protein
VVLNAGILITPNTAQADITSAQVKVNR